jgi:hypothetical protein
MSRLYPKPPCKPNQSPICPSSNTSKKFWTGNSEYARYKRDIKKKPLTPYYISMNHDDVQRHIAPFPGFAGVTVRGLTKALLKRWMIWLAGRNTLRRKKDGTVFEDKIMSGRRANSVLQSMRVAIRWAVDNEDIAIDPFRRLGEVAENLRKKGVLTLEERNTLITVPISDPHHLAVLLGCRGPSRGSVMMKIHKADQREIIAIDGKTVRGHFKNGGKALHLVSAWATENRLVFGQVKTEEKSNEITAIPTLLEKLALEGCIVTIDAAD